MAPRSTRQLHNGLRLARSGVPRLWRAARRAGADRRAALDVVVSAGCAFALASRQSPTEFRQQNAVRHFVWQAYLTVRHDRGLAGAVARAQEAGSADAADTEVDEQNNVVGQEYGHQHAARLSRRRRGDLLRHLADDGERLWEERVLVSVPRKDGSDPRD